MTYLPSLPADAKLLDVFRRFPAPAAALLEFHEILLRGPSPFSVAERELIAAYTSGLNACGYCHGVHTATAEAFGIAEGTLTALLEDIDTADIDERLKPVLRYVKKLTLTPNRIVAADAQAVFAAGWSEQALHDGVAVCSLFNLMNRLVDGLGVSADETWYEQSADRLHQIGYEGLKGLIGPQPQASRHLRSDESVGEDGERRQEHGTDQGEQDAEETPGRVL